MKIVIKKNINNYFLVMILSIFLFSYTIRSSILSGPLGYINIIFLICLFTLIKKGIKLNLRFNLFNILLILISCVIILFIDIKLNNSLDTSFQVIISMLLPLILLNIDYLTLITDKKSFLLKILKTLNFFIIIILFYMLIDSVSHCSISKLLGSIFYKVNNYIPNNTSFLKFRSFSYLGHSLFNKHLFLSFYLINMTYYSITSKKIMNIGLVHFIALCGILLTQSKSGILILFIGFLYFNLKNKNRIINITLLIFGLFILYYFGFFDIIINRFLTTSLTTGRTRWWQYVNERMNLQLYFFNGYGANMQQIITSSFDSSFTPSYSTMVYTAAFEYPLLIMGYKYGLFVTIIWVYNFALRTIFNLFKTQNFVVAFAFICMIIEVNTFNQLVYNPDLIMLIVMWNIIFNILGYINNIKIIGEEF